jgi:predicted AlkP superfamily pyrophosphatase or phosphodiesterase
LNRNLREAGLLAVREELGREILDAGASEAFAVADHQLAHVYVKDPARVDHVRRLLSGVPGVAAVLDRAGQADIHLDHARSGELVCLAAPEAWFTYYFWLDDARAPDYARTVDIHRKPGYDPVELFLDPKLASPKAKIAWTLAKRKLGMRSLMEVIPLDATLVRGSHGLATPPDQGAILMSSQPDLIADDRIRPTEVADLILRHLA